MSAESTILVLSGMGIPPYSARGLQQTLTHIEQAAGLRRTVNGSLVDLSDPAFRKYASTITGSDIDPPALESAWPGLVLTVDCIPELATPSNTETETGTETEQVFDRTAVPGSVREEAGFTFYRPRLSMRVTGFNINRDEWGAVTDWTLQLEEV